MSKRLILTLPDDIFKHIDESAKSIGVTKLEYIRYIIMKDKENKDKESK
jgi:hypothetical protein